MFTDGSAWEQRYGAGLVLISPDEVELTYALKLDFHCSNNKAEYEAVLAGFRIAKQMGARDVEAFVYSLLVANQINQVYEVKDESNYGALAGKNAFNTCTVHHIPQSSNKKPDVLSKLAVLVLRNVSHEIHIEVLVQPSVDNVEVNVIATEAQDTWMKHSSCIWRLYQRQ
jgi:ribonuclease HI